MVRIKAYVLLPLLVHVNDHVQSPLLACAKIMVRGRGEEETSHAPEKGWME
jgi:hypothetical protein